MNKEEIEHKINNLKQIILFAEELGQDVSVYKRQIKELQQKT